MDEIRVNDLASRFAAICGEAHVEAGDGIGPRYQSDWLGKAVSGAAAETAVSVLRCPACP